MSIVSAPSPPNRWPRSKSSIGKCWYSAVTTLDFETDADLARIAKMPGVKGVGVMSRLLLPAHLNSATDVRNAAAQLHADIVVLYSMDTSFRTDTTRVCTLKLNNDHSSLRFPNLPAATGTGGIDYMIHHLLSHTDGADWLKVNQFFTQQVAYIAERIQAARR